MGNTVKKYRGKVEELKDVLEQAKNEHPLKTNKEIGSILASRLNKSEHYMSVLLGVYDKLYSSKKERLSKPEKKKYDSSTDDKFEKRAVGDAIRNEDGKITHYEYEILIRDQEPLKGSFSREEMNTVYRLYSSNDGANLNQRSVSREFPSITFRDFKRIIRAFNITKDSIAVAPHILEENDPEKVAGLIRQEKENSVLKSLAQDRSKHYESLWKKTLSKLVDLQNNRDYGKELIRELLEHDRNSSPIRIEKKVLKDGRIAMNVYLADIHIGARTMADSLYSNPWNEKEALKIVSELLNEVMEVHSIFGRLDTINLIHLGDGVDGMNGKTTGGLRGTSHHDLPQNMNNKEQIKVWLKLMKMTIDAVHKADVANNIKYYTTTDDNHSGDFLYGAYLALEEFCKWKYPDMEYVMFEKFLGHFNCGIHTFVCTHGKDKEHRKSGMPLAIDNKTETFINEYLDVNRLYHPNVHVVKADLHQSARQSVARFDYKNVFSAYGASAWIHANFGVGQAGIDYDIFWMGDSRVLEGRIKFKRGSIWDQ